MTAHESIGPIDVTLLEFSEDTPTGEVAAELLAAAHPGLLGEDDVADADAGSMLTPGSMAVVLEDENTWAEPLTFTVHLAVASSPQVCAFPHRLSPTNSTCSKQRRRPSKFQAQKARVLAQ